ncbi:hypothetical protein [Parapedomonas caeni]
MREGDNSLILLHYFETHLEERFKNDSLNNDVNRIYEYFESKISSIQKIFEEQDLFVTVLWENVLGHDFSEGGYVKGEYIPTTYDELVKVWGVRPPWVVETDQLSFQFNYLKRMECYPWSNNAPWLSASAAGTI